MDPDTDRAAEESAAENTGVTAVSAVAEHGSGELLLGSDASPDVMPVTKSTSRSCVGVDGVLPEA